MQHFKSSNIKLSIFEGLCEEKEKHFHPCFFFFFFDQNQSSFFTKTFILETNEHFHDHEFSSEDLDNFIKNQEIIIETSEEEGHSHKILLNSENQIEDFIDLFSEIDNKEIIEEDEEELDD